MKVGVKNVDEKIVKAKETLKGKEGAALRESKKQVKRLQRKRNKIAADKKRMDDKIAKKAAAAEAAAPKEEAPAA